MSSFDQLQSKTKVMADYLQHLAENNSNCDGHYEQM